MNITTALGSLAIAGSIVLTSTLTAGDGTTPPIPSRNAATPDGIAEKKPHEMTPLHQAYVALGHAKTDLVKADHDFGGHRKSAIEAIEKAMAEIKTARQFEKSH